MGKSLVWLALDNTWAIGKIKKKNWLFFFFHTFNKAQYKQIYDPKEHNTLYKPTKKTTHPRWNKSTLKNLLNSMENSSVACSSHILCKIKHSMNNPLNLFTFLSINYKYCLLTEKKKDYLQLVKTVTVLAQSISNIYVDFQVSPLYDVKQTSEIKQVNKYSEHCRFG